MNARPRMTSVILTMLLAATSAMATSFTYSDTSNPWSSGGNAITYTLDIDLDPGNRTGSAAFHIDTTMLDNPAFYAVEFDFKFVTGNDRPDLFNLSAPAGSGPWTILDQNNASGIKKGNSCFNTLSGSAAGFAASSLLCNGSALPDSPDYTDGIRVNSGDNSFAFTFDFDLGDKTFRSDGEVPFQAIFFRVNGSQESYKGQLSVELGECPECGPVVPEPTTLLLLGTGIVGLGCAAYRRKK